MAGGDPPHDEIGYWSEIKLDIIREYAAAYSRILNAQPGLQHVYIDAFAGSGRHRAKRTGAFVPGSPMNALLVKPPFREYFFIDLNDEKIASLEKLAAQRPDAHVLRGDCNQILKADVFPRVKWEDYRRGLCILDPYGLHLDWSVIAEAAAMRSIEIFLNFPVANMNRNVLWRDREGVPTDQVARMDAFWGDSSWRTAAYAPARQSKLFGPPDEEKVTNDEIAGAFRERLKTVARFKHVPEPVAMRNSQNAIVYYLFFASHNRVAPGIVEHIFAKHRDRKGA